MFGWYYDFTKTSDAAEVNVGDSVKKYVEVTAVFAEDGKLKPIKVHWEDGRCFEIDRIVDIRRAASLKAGGCGMRYTCIISGQRSYLFYDDSGRWFVEKKF